jgi:hypothetical protein
MCVTLAPHLLSLGPVEAAGFLRSLARHWPSRIVLYRDDSQPGAVFTVASHSSFENGLLPAVDGNSGWDHKRLLGKFMEQRGAIATG